MKKVAAVLLCACCLITLASPALAGQNLSVGYGFGLFNQAHGTSNKVEGDKNYTLLQVLYGYEVPMTSWFSLLAEPYAAYVFQPTGGFELGLYLSGKVYPYSSGASRLYFLLGTGGMYTSVDFEEQPGNYLFILHAGVGFQYKNFFLEDRFRHLSNGGTRGPNHSIQANIVSIGIVF